MRALFVFVLLGAGCTQRSVDVLTLLDLEGVHFDLAGTDGPGPSLCTTANVELCDGFEGAQVDSPPWEFVEIGADVSLDSTHVYRGNQAILVKTNTQTVKGVYQGELTETQVVPQPDFFLRVFLYLPSPAPPKEQFRIFGLLQKDSPNSGPQISINNGNLQVDVIDGTGSITSTTPVPLDTWSCIEWEVLAGATAGQYHVWLNGTEIPKLAFVGDTSPTNGVGRFSFGAAFFGPPATQPSYDFWYDELILDSSRIGCAR